MSGKFCEVLETLAALEPKLYNRDFLLTWQHTESELRAVLLVAELLEQLHESNIATRMFETGLAVSIFRDKSTRTRFSFASAASLLGLSLQELDEAKSQITHGETLRETANMISFLTEVIGIRDDLYLDEGHAYMASVAAAVDEGYREKVLPQRPAVINLQCDRDHPTQSMADMLHLSKVFKSLKNLKGKKLAMTWAYSPSYGKPLSVPQGIISLMTRFGMEVVLAHPEGYDLLPETIKNAKQFAAQSGGAFRIADNMEEAFQDADVVYPKSWAPIHVMRQRTELLRSDLATNLDALERECLDHNARHIHWTCDAEMMKRTRNGRALYMHCLPADITGVSCEKGEVSADVFEQFRLDTYREASHKPYIIAAMILLTRHSNASQLLRKICEEAPQRIKH